MIGLQYLKDVVTLALDGEKCNGCRMCVNVCPQGVFAFENRRAKIVERDACMECGACARNCLAGAISVEAGTGCARALIKSAIFGTEPICECSSSKSDCC
ncbi:MAG: mercury methylation ferredoxin HgcB [Thermoguttaceae bacterium]|jgi:NAD-dependent dihydropyrimidine dehydrogenase PreA subunit